MIDYNKESEIALLMTICSYLLDEHTRMTGGQIREMLYDALDML